MALITAVIFSIYLGRPDPIRTPVDWVYNGQRQDFNSWYWNQAGSVHRPINAAYIDPIRPLVDLTLIPSSWLVWACCPRYQAADLRSGPESRWMPFHSPWLQTVFDFYLELYNQLMPFNRPWLQAIYAAEIRGCRNPFYKGHVRSGPTWAVSAITSRSERVLADCRLNQLDSGL